MFDIEEHLKKHNIQPYLNRVMIFEYIYNNHTHPTVEEVYNSVKKKNSSLSKMTVYNVLKLLVEAELIREVTINEKETRYDIKVRDHGHFKCEKCNKIFDFEVDMESIKTENLSNCKIEKKDLFFHGICDQCLADIGENHK